MKESVALLYEGLYELNELVDQAVREKPFLYENAGYSPSQIIILEAEGEEGFLKRTSSAIEKVKMAAKAGVKELKALNDAVANTIPPMVNSSSAIEKAIADLEKKMPGDGLLSKLGSLGGGAWNALFGEDDDPVEAVTQIVADGLQFKTMLANVTKSVLEMLNQIEPAEVVDQAAEDAAASGGDTDTELSGEQKKKYIDEIKNLLMNGTINDILTSDDEMYVEVREATGFSEKDIEKALKTSVKPAKWFSGLKSVGASLGIGLGGDLPFKKYGLKQAGVISDITAVKISDLQKLSGVIQPSESDSAVADELTKGVEQISDLENEKDRLDQTEVPSGDEPVDTDQEAQSEDQGEDEEVETRYVKILKSVPGLKDPTAAGEKLATLLAAGVNVMKAMSLKSLLAEKVLRYDDVVDTLEDHLPDAAEEIPAVIRKLADEMKVELGAEYDIVGGPNELDAIKSELESLRNLLGQLPEDEIEDAIDTVAAELDDEFNLTQDASAVEDLVDPDVDLESVIDEIPEEDLDAWEGLPTSWEDWLNVALRGGDDEKPEKKQKSKREPGTFWKLDKEQSKGEKYGAKGQGPKSKKVRYFRTEKGAEKYSLKTERIALARMRGFILRESNDFKMTSFLSSSEVIAEFYRRGGTNKLLMSEIKTHRHVSSHRWQKIAGLKNE